MTTEPGLIELDLVVSVDQEWGEGEADRLMSNLRAEIIGLDVVLSRRAAGEDVPDGAKVGDPVSLSALIVALSASGSVFPTLIALVRHWLDRQTTNPKVTVIKGKNKIVLEKATAEQQQALVDDFIRDSSTD